MGIPAQDGLPADSQIKKAFIIISGLLLAVTYVGFAAAHFLATEFSARGEFVALQWAARLDPWNEKYQDLLGRFQLFGDPNLDHALPFLHRAVALNRYSARSWLDLATANYLIEDRKASISAIEQAIAAEPKTPDVAWEAANLYVALGEKERALQTFRLVIEGSPSLQGAAFEHCWRLEPNATTLLQNVIPPDRDAVGNFLEFLVINDQRPDAAAAWAELAEMRGPIARQHVFNYIQYLISHHDFVQAALVWRQAAEQAGLSHYQPSPQNLVVNGDFQYAVLNAGFDWRYDRSPDILLSLDPTQTGSDFRSLKISFDSRGTADAGIYQLVSVAPNIQYEFAADFRTEGLQGAGGLRFAVQDFLTGSTYYSSEDLKSDSAWSQAKGIFSTGPDATLSIVHIQRVPAGNAIRGTLWIDHVRLSPARLLDGVKP